MVTLPPHKKCQMCGKPSYGKRCMDCFKKEHHNTLSRMYRQRRKNNEIRQSP